MDNEFDTLTRGNESPTVVMLKKRVERLKELNAEMRDLLVSFTERYDIRREDRERVGALLAEGAQS